MSEAAHILLKLTHLCCLTKKTQDLAICCFIIQGYMTVLFA